jgi:hypothetical protein
MKVKVGTLLDADLLQQAKKYSVSRKIPLNELIELSIESYLEEDAEKGLLSLEDILEAEPGSHGSEGSGRGA